MVTEDGVAASDRLLVQSSVLKTTSQTYNNYVLPLTIDLTKFGSVTLQNNNTYVVETGVKSFLIETSEDLTTNKVRLLGAGDIKWTDTKIYEDTFKREIGKNIFYIRGGEIIVKSKELNAKPFSKSSIEKKITPSNRIMAMDTESILTQDRQQVPYLICG